MSYETAPATLLLATRCCVCGRPLVDAASVEAGIGPDCREKYGYNADVPEEARTEANKLVFAIAAGTADVAQAITILRDVYGFTVLANTLIDRKCAVKITAPQPDLIALDTEYRAAFVADLKASVRYNARRWDPGLKVWLVSAIPECKARAWGALRRHFRGALGVAPDGRLFTI